MLYLKFYKGRQYHDRYSNSVILCSCNKTGDQDWGAHQKKKKKERKKERKKNLIHKYMPINKTTQVKTHLVLTKSSMYPPMLFSMYLPMLLIIFCFPFRNKRLYVRVSFNSNSKKGIKNNWKFDENVLWL